MNKGLFRTDSWFIPETWVTLFRPPGFFPGDREVSTAASIQVTALRRLLHLIDGACLSLGALIGGRRVLSVPGASTGTGVILNF